jgi:Ca2+-binding EF-hand superfamily protein
MKRTNLLLILVAVAMLIAVCLTVNTAVARQSSTAKLQDNYALGQPGVEDLLPLMDADHDGTVTEQEFMGYMKTEFQRLDKDETGAVDLSQLMQTGVHPKYFNSAGK